MHVSISIVVTHENGAGVSKGQMFADPTPDEIADAIILVMNGCLPKKVAFETLEQLRGKELSR